MKDESGLSLFSTVRAVTISSHIIFSDLTHVVSFLIKEIVFFRYQYKEEIDSKPTSCSFCNNFLMWVY